MTLLIYYPPKKKILIESKIRKHRKKVPIYQNQNNSVPVHILKSTGGAGTETVIRYRSTEIRTKVPKFVQKYRNSAQKYRNFVQ